MLEPTTEVLEVSPRRLDRRLLLVLGVGVLVVALVVGGLSALERIRGGASSPTALATGVTEALDREDVPALLRLVEPTERRALLRLARSWADRLDALVLPATVGGATQDPFRGVEVTLSGTTPRIEAQNGDLAVVGLPDLTVHLRTDPGEAHGLLLAWLTYLHLTQTQQTSYGAADLPLGLKPQLVAVQRSGRWYLSVLGTALGPGVASGSSLRPVDRGRAAPTPQAAVEATLRALVDLRSAGGPDRLAATLDPSGADAVDLWASEVVLPESPATQPRVESLSTAAGPEDGDLAVVEVSSLHSSGSGPDLDAGCLTWGDAYTCLSDGPYRYADGIVGLRRFALLGHDGTFRLTALHDRTGWRTSLPDSVADALTAYAADLSRSQVLALLHRPTLDAPDGSVRPDVAADVRFTDAGYALVRLHLDRAGLYRVVPSPSGTNRAAVYDADGQPAIQPFYPNDSAYRLEAGDHLVLVWADDEFAAAKDRGTPYVQRVEVRSVR